MKLRIKSFSLDRSCLYSNLQIRDGQSSTSDSLNKLCGEKAAELSVFSSGRYLRIELHSLRIPVETPYYAAGFDAVYEAVKQCKIQTILSKKMPSIYIYKIST